MICNSGIILYSHECDKICPICNIGRSVPSPSSKVVGWQGEGGGGGAAASSTSFNL